jgi:hypothetical protein
MKDMTISRGNINQPKLLPGLSANFWVKTTLLILAFCGIGLAGVPLSAWILQDKPAKSVVMFIFAFIGITAGICLIGAGVCMGRAMSRESRAGYTTLYDTRKSHLWLLDPRSGEVLRKPGEKMPRSNS